MGHLRPYRWYVPELESELRDPAVESMSLSMAQGFLSANGRNWDGQSHPGLGVKTLSSILASVLTNGKFWTH